MVDRIVQAIVICCVIAAIIPLGSILVEVFRNGAAAISIEFLTQTPGAIGTGDGGIGPAIQGTLIVIGLSSIIGVPIGVMSGIFLAEFGDNRLAKLVRFFNDAVHHSLEYLDSRKPVEQDAAKSGKMSIHSRIRTGRNG